jgi:hypothetical protein
MIKSLGNNKVADALQPKSEPADGKGGPTVGLGLSDSEVKMVKTGATMKSDGDPGTEKAFSWPSKSECQKGGKIS